mmetsp:Transcript_38277/g.71817  ORF Transcript_38277/g.71817 Transcript_38277/m.71817 type:complete len:86 (-) Transcript_38277:177-434(-)
MNCFAGLEDSLQTLKQVLHDELISQEKMLRSSQERLQGLEDNTRGERKARSTYARPSAACEVRAEVGAVSGACQMLQEEIQLLLA